MSGLAIGVGIAAGTLVCACAAYCGGKWIFNNCPDELVERACCLNGKCCCRNFNAEESQDGSEASRCAAITGFFSQCASSCTAYFKRDPQPSSEETVSQPKEEEGPDVVEIVVEAPPAADAQPSRSYFAWARDCCGTAGQAVQNCYEAARKAMKNCCETTGEVVQNLCSRSASASQPTVNQPAPQQAPAPEQPAASRPSAPPLVAQVRENFEQPPAKPAAARKPPAAQPAPKPAAPKKQAAAAQPSKPAPKPAALPTVSGGVKAMKDRWEQKSTV